MAGHARLKNEFTEVEKCHNLRSWLKYPLTIQMLQISILGFNASDLDLLLAATVFDVMQNHVFPFLRVKFKLYEWCFLISAIGFVTQNLRFHPNQSTRIIKYSLLPTIIIENQRSFPVQLCNMGLATVVP